MNSGMLMTSHVTVGVDARASVLAQGSFESRGQTADAHRRSERLRVMCGGSSEWEVME